MINLKLTDKQLTILSDLLDITLDNDRGDLKDKEEMLNLRSKVYLLKMMEDKKFKL